MPVSLVEWSNSFKEKEHFINFAEFVALVAVYLSVPEVVRGRFVLHFGDNETANQTAIKGSSRARDLAEAVTTLRFVWVSLQVSPWVARVASKSNPADGPTRDDFSFEKWVQGRGEVLEWVEFVCPDLGGWDCFGGVMEYESFH